MIFLVLISFDFNQCVTDIQFWHATHFFSSDSSHALIFKTARESTLCNKDTDPTSGSSVAKHT